VGVEVFGVLPLEGPGMSMALPAAHRGTTADPMTTTHHQEVMESMAVARPLPSKRTMSTALSAEEVLQAPDHCLMAGPSLAEALLLLEEAIMKLMAHLE